MQRTNRVAQRFELLFQGQHVVDAEIERCDGRVYEFVDAHQQRPAVADGTGV